MLLHVVIFHKTSPLVFAFSSVILFIISRPKYLLSPENLIFLYYFTWYGMAPLLAERFSGYSFGSAAEINAYNMLYAVYAFSLLVLLWVRHYFNFRFRGYCVPRKSGILTVTFFSIMALSLYGYILATGGAQAWLADAKMAFISREGAGVYYLVYTHALMVFVLLICYRIHLHGGGAIKYMLVILMIILMYPFIGSKLKVIMIAALALSPFLIRSNLYSRTSFLSVSGVFVLVLLGLYLRNSSWMTLKDIAPYFFNYFNTLEMFVTLLRDFDPGFFESAFLPINKVLMKFDGFFMVPYHDMSIWLTSIYYPDADKVGATEQWPIEADFYLSFGFWGGFLFLFFYLLWLSYLHQGARTGNLAFCMIYIMEFFFIISHYRGGLFLWWYYYLVPFYVIIFFLFRKFQFNYSTQKIFPLKGEGV